MLKEVECYRVYRKDTAKKVNLPEELANLRRVISLRLAKAWMLNVRKTWLLHSTTVEHS